MSKSNYRQLEYGGKKYSLNELAEKTGIGIGALVYRISKLGLTVDQAVDIGSGKKKRITKQFCYHGEMLSLKEIARRSGRCYDVIRRKMVQGMTAEEAVLDFAQTPEEQKRKAAALETAYHTATMNMSAAERQRYNVAMCICRGIARHNPFEFNFRCVQPMKEYAFESDILGYRIIFSGNMATLTAYYRQHNAPSDLHRRYLVTQDRIKEIR